MSEQQKMKTPEIPDIQGANAVTQQPARLDAQTLSVEVQNAFTQGWKDAGGYMGDLHSESPFFAPWSRDEIIEVRGEDPYEWGKAYWNEKKEELANAALLEAFDRQGMTVAQGMMASPIMHAVPEGYIYGQLHRGVSPSFEPAVLVEPLRVFALRTAYANPEQLSKLTPENLATFTEMTGIHLESAELYVFTDDSVLLRDGEVYWEITPEEAKVFEQKLTEF